MLLHRILIGCLVSANYHLWFVATTTMFHYSSFGEKKTNQQTNTLQICLIFYILAQKFYDKQ